MRPNSISILLLAAFGLVALSSCEPRPGAPPGAEQPVAPPSAPAAARTELTSRDDWCAGHGLPESMCTQCNPELTEHFQSSGDWCEAHGFPESACPVCNPLPPPGEAGQPAADWCVEHALPESKCTKCNPSLVAEYDAAGDYCEEHGFPESVCPKCNPQSPPAGAEQAAIEARVVRLANPELERIAGIQTVAAERGRASAAVECTARIAFDADRVADVRALLPGIVRRVRTELGAKVKRGAPLFELQSTHVGEAQGDLQTARAVLRTAKANVVRLRELRARGVAPQRELELAEEDFASARIGVSTAQAVLKVSGASGSEPSGRYTVPAPIAGTVVRRPAVLGLLAHPDESLALLVDTSVMWALCDVPEAYAARVAVGQHVTVSVEGANGPPIDGELTWIASEVDERTRTVVARAELPNLDGGLRANQFARARIGTGASKASISVPRGAVQRVGEHEVVFVRTAKGVYEPRVVQRHGDDDPVLVDGRVEPADPVVTTGAVLLRTEVLPGSIGAGCCEVELPGAD